MNKQEIYEFLNQKGIEYEITEHEALYSMDEISDVDLPYPESDAKNLFLRDNKKKNYYLITVKGNKRVDLKEFRKTHGTKPLSFASSEDLFSILKLVPGSVSPFGLLNDEDRKVEFFIDENFMEGSKIIGCHPNDNTATVWMKISDLISIIKKHGNKINIVKI